MFWLKWNHHQGDKVQDDDGDDDCSTCAETTQFEPMNLQKAASLKYQVTETEIS